jgi:hypothetical protein
MTIYSQHANRGKVQILATYRSPSGLTSTTVTSVDAAETAEPVVNALNRISACATAPLSAWDRRGGKFSSHPVEHLQALPDPDQRARLRRDAHSLWYAYVTVLLHHALDDLDEAAAGLPAPVRTALAAEVRIEGEQMTAEWHRNSDNVVPADGIQRVWDLHSPTVLFDGGMPELADEIREQLDEAEEELSEAELRTAMEQMRLLADARHRCHSDTVRFEQSYFTISEDPYLDNDQRYFVEIAAPRPQRHYRDSWSVEIQQWIPDPGFDEATGGTESAVSVLSCALPSAPPVEQITALLAKCGNEPKILSTWATTAPGETLAGTPFVVTERYDGRHPANWRIGSAAADTAPQCAASAAAGNQTSLADAKLVPRHAALNG